MQNCNISLQLEFTEVMCKGLSLNGNDGLKPISALLLAVMNFGYATRKVSYEEKFEIPYVSLK